MQLRNYLESMESGELIVVSKDRFDIIIGALVANYSRTIQQFAREVSTLPEKDGQTSQSGGFGLTDLLGRA